MNLSINYYSDEISFTEPQFNRYMVSRNLSLPSRSSGTIEESLEINFFNTNTYFRGILGFDPYKLSSLKYSP